MATVHTLNEPIHTGEKRLSRILSSIDDPLLNLWFSVNHIPQVNDLDIVLWHQEVALFIIEVKAFALRDIHSFGLASWLVGDHLKSRSPQVQALDAMWALRNYIEPKMGFTKLPYTIPTVCFPKIKRSEWRHRWSGTPEIVDQGDSFLFEEDISGGAEVFKSRLKIILLKPPIGNSPRPPFNAPQQKSLNAFISGMDVTASPKPTITDLERLTALEKSVSREVKREFVPFSNISAVFYGHPGTGKTFRLLQIGLHHAQEGARVLFACFNKVLAADLRRLLYLLSVIAKDKYTPNLFDHVTDEEFSSTRILEAFDVFQLALQVQTANAGLLDSPNENLALDDWGQKLVSDISENKELFALKKYDTILIDEAQDLKDWQYDLIKLHSSEKPTVVVAFGKGQELYDESNVSQEWLEKIKTEGAIEKPLKRNFRNSKSVFQVAYTFSLAAPDSNKIQTIMKKFASGSDGKPEVEFDRVSSALPRIVGINEAALPDSEFPEFDDAISDQYLDIIEGELENLHENGEPIDLLVLVPDGKSIVHDHVKKSLDKLYENKLVGHIDYTDERHRRLIAPNDKIRFCTFHSARGLEGARVIVFGIERIRKSGEELNFDFKKLGFIVLSRSTFDCLIIRRSFDQEIAPFLEKSLAALRQEISPVLF